MNDAHRRKIHAAVTAAFRYSEDFWGWQPTAAIARKLHNAGVRAPDVMLFVLLEKQAGRLEVGRRAQPGPKAWQIRPTAMWLDAADIEPVGSEFDAFAAKLLAECDVKVLPDGPDDEDHNEEQPMYGPWGRALEQLADEIEAHAETRKRLLKLQHRMRCYSQGYPIGLAQLAVLTFWGRNTKEDINAARTNRKALHLAGRGVPR